MRLIIASILLGIDILFPQIVQSEWREVKLPLFLRDKDVIPKYIALNQFRDLYILDDENYWLIYLSAERDEYRIAGGWGVKGDRFDLPTDLFASVGLDVYVCDNSTHRILRFDRKLNFIAELDVSSVLPQPIEFPYRVISNTLGELFIANSTTWEVNLVTPDTQFSTTLGDATYGENRFQEIQDLAVNPENSVAVVDLGKSVFYELSRAGRIQKEIPLPGESLLFAQWWKDRWVVASEDGALFFLSGELASFQKIPALFPSSEFQITDFDVVGDDLFVVDGLSGSIFTATFENFE